MLKGEKTFLLTCLSEVLLWIYTAMPFTLSNFLHVHTVIRPQFRCVLQFSFFTHYCLHLLPFCIPILPSSCAPHSASTCIWSLWWAKMIHFHVKFLCHSSTQQGGWMTVGWNIQLLFHIEMKSMFLSWSKECFQTTANWWYQCWCNLHTASQSMGQTAVLQQQNLWLWHRSTFFLFHRCLNIENALFSPFSVRHRWKTVV